MQDRAARSCNEYTYTIYLVHRHNSEGQAPAIDTRSTQIGMDTAERDGDDAGTLPEEEEDLDELITAVFENDLTSVRDAIVKGGASANHADPEGSSLLSIAAFMGFSPMVSLLLELKADPNQKNHIGWTPLTAAANKGHYEIAAALARAGAVVVTDIHGLDAQQYAQENGFGEISSMLRAYLESGTLPAAPPSHADAAAAGTAAHGTTMPTSTSTEKGGRAAPADEAPLVAAILATAGHLPDPVVGPGDILGASAHAKCLHMRLAAHLIERSAATPQEWVGSVSYSLFTSPHCAHTP